MKKITKAMLKGSRDMVIVFPLTTAIIFITFSFGGIWESFISNDFFVRIYLLGIVPAFCSATYLHYDEENKI